MPSEENKSKEQQAAESEVESFRKDLGPFVVAAETTRMAMVFADAKEADHPLIFANNSRPVLQKPMQRSELSDALAKLLTPKEPGVESVIAALAEMSF